MTFFSGRIGISPSVEAFLLLEISAFGVSTFDGIVKGGRRSHECEAELVNVCCTEQG